MNADLQQINNELNSFVEFCKKNQITDQEIANICRPLTSAIQKAQLKRKVLLILAVATLLTATYYIASVDFISWHLSAVGRLILIELLPIWNWQHLKNEKCLLPNYVQQIKQTQLNCVLCESLDHIYIEHDVNPTYLNEHYLDLHKPLILTYGLHNWHILQDKLLEDPAFYESIPCKLSTNIHNGLAPVGRILRKLHHFNKYFLHFQNCDFNAMKAFRTVSPRPLFLPAEISPVQYNWLLISRNYNVSNFKIIELTEAITVIGQTKGSNYFRLVPRLNCENLCPVLELELNEGEALVFTSMWDLEYKPNAHTENVAIILEMH